MDNIAPTLVKFVNTISDVWVLLTTLFPMFNHIQCMIKTFQLYTFTCGVWQLEVSWGLGWTNSPQAQNYNFVVVHALESGHFGACYLAIPQHEQYNPHRGIRDSIVARQIFIEQKPL